MSANSEMYEVIRQGDGFIAALDQSGGSTPKALGMYGVTEDAWSSEDEMFALIHAMRSRIATDEAFNGERIIGAILFEQTMDSEIEGKGSATYLWEDKGVVPFLKVDKGLADEEDGVQVMKPNPGLDALVARGVEKGIWGTKMRSVVKVANKDGIQRVVDQQFEVGKQILAGGLMPILEPEVDIHSPSKAEAEALLRDALLAGLDSLGDDQLVMFKLTLPEEPGFYDVLVDHPKVLRVVALSGGYSRDEANERLSKNRGVIASFSRALSEGLSAQQSDEEFHATLDDSIQAIYDASVAG